MFLWFPERSADCPGPFARKRYKRLATHGSSDMGHMYTAAQRLDTSYQCMLGKQIQCAQPKTYALPHEMLAAFSSWRPETSISGKRASHEYDIMILRTRYRKCLLLLGIGWDHCTPSFWFFRLFSLKCFIFSSPIPVFAHDERDDIFTPKLLKIFWQPVAYEIIQL